VVYQFGLFCHLNGGVAGAAILGWSSAFIFYAAADDHFLSLSRPLPETMAILTHLLQHLVFLPFHTQL
jgi:hypothetical protein